VLKEEKVPRIKKALRTRILNQEDINKMQRSWIRQTPYDIHNEALEDLLKVLTHLWFDT